MEILTASVIEKAKKTKSAEELLAFAKENGVEMTKEEAETCFAQLHVTGELSDGELDAVAGGGCGGSFKTYPEVGQGVCVGGGFKCTSCGETEGIVMKKYKNAGSSVNLDVQCKRCGTHYTILADCRNAFTIL